MCVPSTEYDSNGVDLNVNKPRGARAGSVTWIHPDYIRSISGVIRIYQYIFRGFSGFLADFSGYIIADYPVEFELNSGSLRIIRLVS